MKTLCLTLAILLPCTAFGQSTYAGAPCAADDNACILRALLFQTRELEQKRLASEHLQAALDAKTSEAQALQSALSKSQKDAAKTGADRPMWVCVGAVGGIVLTTLIVFVTNHAAK